MARKAKDEVSDSRKQISADEIKRVIKDLIKHKQNAAEASALHGNAAGKVVERFGLERKSLTWTRQLAEMDDGKRQGIIRQCLDLWHKMDYFAQVDAFDDVIPLMEGIAADAKKRQGKPARSRAKKEEVTDPAAGQPAGEGDQPRMPLQ